MTTADKWLDENGKKPYTTGDYPFYYWGTMADFDPNDPDNEPDESDFLLPEDVFARLKQRTTYPNVKSYWTAEEALADFRQAFQPR